MKKILLILVLLEAALIIYLLQARNLPKKIQNPVAAEQQLLKYTFANLKKYKPVTSGIGIENEIRKGTGFISYLYFFRSNGKRISGLLNIPSQPGKYPIMLLIRGFVDPSVYETGMGSQRVGEYFASKGFITVSPDFLGYGQSDKPSNDAFEDRFQTYITIIDLLSSLPNLNVGLEKKELTGFQADVNKIGIWAHSNGGQIMLSVAEITGINYPLVLWAPVTKPFPYSILYYTDEFDDRGKALRKVLAKFEQSYDVEQYSLTNYYDWIKAPIQVHQGISDEEVPVVWSDELENNMKDKKKEIEYYRYAGEDHNFQNGSWSLAVERSLEFIKNNLPK